MRALVYGLATGFIWLTASLVAMLITSPIVHNWSVIIAFNAGLVLGAASQAAFEWCQSSLKEKENKDHVKDFYDAG